MIAATTAPVAGNFITAPSKGDEAGRRGDRCGLIADNQFHCPSSFIWGAGAIGWRPQPANSRSNSTATRKKRHCYHTIFFLESMPSPEINTCGLTAPGRSSQASTIFPYNNGASCKLVLPVQGRVQISIITAVPVISTAPVISTEGRNLRQPIAGSDPDEWGCIFRY